MGLWPHRTVTLEVPLSPPEVMEAVAGQTDRWSPLLPVVGARPFHGQLARSSFTLMRVTIAFRAVRPVVHGTVEPTPDGSSVMLRIRPERSQAYSLVCVNTLLVGWLVYAGIAVPAVELPWLAVPLVLVAAADALYAWGFKVEADRAERLFGQLLRPPA